MNPAKITKQQELGIVRQPHKNPSQNPMAFGRIRQNAQDEYVLHEQNIFIQLPYFPVQATGKVLLGGC